MGNSETSYIEGDVVVCPGRETASGDSDTIGTIVQIFGKELTILDRKGYMHRCQAHEVFLAEFLKEEFK